MKVCMILRNLFPPIDERPHREAKTLINAGYEVNLFCMRGNSQECTDEIDGINIHRTKKWTLPFYLDFAIPASLSLLRHRANNYDIFHIHNPPDSLILSSIFYKIVREHKVILDIHDPMIPALLQNPNKYTKFRLLIAKFWEKVALDRSDELIVVSNGSKERLISLGVNEDKIHVIRNYVDLGVFNVKNATPAHIIKRYKLENKRIVLYPGSISPIRGQDILIKAVAELGKEHKDLYLVIVGNKSKYWCTLLKLAKKLSIDKQMKLITWQPYKEMANFMAAAEICVEPRKYSYHTAVTGNPNKLYQYMAMKKPIVATDVPAISDFVDENTAVLVKPDSVKSMAEGLRKVMEDKNFAKKISENAYRLAIEKYNWKKEGERLLNLYKVL